RPALGVHQQHEHLLLRDDVRKRDTPRRPGTPGRRGVRLCGIGSVLGQVVRRRLDLHAVFRLGDGRHLAQLGELLLGDLLQRRLLVLLGQERVLVVALGRHVEPAPVVAAVGVVVIDVLRLAGVVDAVVVGVVGPAVGLVVVGAVVVAPLRVVAPVTVVLPAAGLGAR